MAASTTRKACKHVKCLSDIVNITLKTTYRQETTKCTLFIPFVILQSYFCSSSTWIYSLTFLKIDNSRITDSKETYETVLNSSYQNVSNKIFVDRALVECDFMLSGM